MSFPRMTDEDYQAVVARWLERIDVHLSTLPTFEIRAVFSEPGHAHVEMVASVQDEP